MDNDSTGCAKKHEIGLFSGGFLNVKNPRDFLLKDIARGLSLKCRFGGQCKACYSVAQHSVYVSRIIQQRYAMEGLMHDAAEAYLGDMVRPLKTLPELTGYRNLEHLAITRIFLQFGLSNRAEAWQEIKRADNAVVRAEAKVLMHDSESWDWGDTEEIEIPGFSSLGDCWDWETAEGEFYQRFEELF